MNYKDAHNEAVRLANLTKRETGVEKINEFGKTVYRAKMLPNRENRAGWELRCQVVKPGDPLSE